MNKLFSTILSVFMLAGISSCIGGGSAYDDPFNNAGGSHHRGDRGDDNGSGGGGTTGGGSSNQSVFPGDHTYSLMADAVYLGDQNYMDVDQFILYLYWGEYDENDDFKTIGTELAFDVLCPKTGKMQLSHGTYTCVSEDYTPFHFLDGVEQDGEVLPSFAYYKSGAGNSKVVVISGGTIEIAPSGTGCTITATFKAESPSNRTIQTYKVRFSGEVAYSDGRNPGDEVPGEVEMKSFSRVVAEYWGQIWDDNDKNIMPIDDWILYLYGGNAEKDNEYTTIEILTEPGSKALSPGIYNEIASLGRLETFKPGAVLAGYTEGDDNIAYGTWYCKNGIAYYAASKGQLAVAVKDNLYSLSFDFTDEDEQFGGSFRGSYTGRIEVADMTVHTKAGAHRGNVMKHIIRTGRRQKTTAARLITAE